MDEGINRPLLGVSGSWDEGLSTSHANGHSNLAHEYNGGSELLEDLNNVPIESKRVLKTYNRAKDLLGDIQPYEGFVFLPLSAVELILMSYGTRCYPTT